MLGRMSTQKWIALVDDDLSVRRALPRLLNSAGYKVRAFSSAAELFGSGFAGSADCLVLDIHLERATGFDLLEKLRAEGNVAPVIFITAYDDEGARDRARGLQAIAYLRKPFDANALLDAVSTALHMADGGSRHTSAK